MKEKKRRMKQWEAYLQWLNNLNMINPPGLAVDTRSEIDKLKDYQHEELAPQAVSLNWNRDMSGAPLYSVRNQDGSGSCVAQSIAKALEIITGTVQSAHPTYRRRRNFPNVGMWLQDGGDLMRHLGTTTDALDPSQNLNEGAMNKDIFVDTPLTMPMYITANFKDIDAIATAIELYKHCIITINGNLKEYAPKEKPVVIPNSLLDCAHAICATYYFTDADGKKCLVIDESWGNETYTRRIITEDYLIARGTGALYFLPPKPTPPITKPQFIFQAPLVFGQSNFSIKNLQDALKYFGFFPASVASTGNYGNVTAKAVFQWQMANQVDTPAILQELAGKRFGSKSIAKMNALLA